MSTARFTFLCTLLTVLVFLLVMVGIGIAALAVLGGLLAILKDHQRLYFSLQHRSSFAYATYAFAVVLMLWVTVSFVPGIAPLVSMGWHLPDPFPAGYALHFALGSIFLLWALNPANTNAMPMTFTGSVFWEQLHLLQQAPRVILGSLKRSGTMITQEHWLKGLVGLLLLVLSIPVGLVALTTGVLAVYWFTVLWAGMSLLVVVPLWLVYKAIHLKGLDKTCPGCGQEHHIAGPGPMGVFTLRCRCGQKIGLWRKSGDTAASLENLSSVPWNQRPRQAGTLPLLILGVTLSLLMASRAFGFWSGPARNLPWASDSYLKEVSSGTHKAPATMGRGQR